MLEDIRIKLVTKLNDSQIRQLVRILNYDKKLNQSLGNKKNKITVKQFKSKNKAWAKDNQAKMFAIMYKNRAIGMISLSHINLKDKKANIGYWLTSKHWGKSITTEAFKQVLAIAKRNKIKYVSCTIAKNNKSSLGIWQTYRASIKRNRDNIIPLIKL
ncbi:MAG: GNAT family N-acetyltransferase [Patescibacteria group bacterium]